jgi:hypothetical protein
MDMFLAKNKLLFTHARVIHNPINPEPLQMIATRRHYARLPGSSEKVATLKPRP